MLSQKTSNISLFDEACEACFAMSPPWKIVEKVKSLVRNLRTLNINRFGDQDPKPVRVLLCLKYTVGFGTEPMNISIDSHGWCLSLIVGFQL